MKFQDFHLTGKSFWFGVSALVRMLLTMALSSGECSAFPCSGQFRVKTLNSRLMLGHPHQLKTKGLRNEGAILERDS